MRGQLILVEGLDRSGKSTQVQNLHESIHNSKVLKFPDRSTKVGQIINEYLTTDISLPDQTIHLLFSANRWELYQQILTDLNNGITIILDRYIYSGIAYSLAKLHLANISNEMANVEWLYGPDKGLPKPDLTMFLTLDLDEIDKRANFGAERYEKRKFQEIVKANFLKLLDVPDESIVLLDVNKKSIEEVRNDIWNVIENGGFDKLTDQEIKYLQ